jgi:ATP-dependent protease ClpP protease subunit
MVESKWAILLKAGQGEEVNLDILDDIGRGVFGGGVAAADVAAKLPREAKQINVSLNTSGGSANDGFQIYNLLKEHPARVVVNIGALAASAGTVVAMAGDEVTIAPNGRFMVHEAQAVIRGTAGDLRKSADRMDAVTQQAVDLYCQRAKVPREKVEELVRAETWLTATQAVELGFVDRIRSQSAPPRMFAELDATMCADRESAPEEFRLALREAVSAATGQQGDQMSEIQVLLSALGCQDQTSAIRLHGELMKLVTETGKASPEEARGVVLAWKESHAELPRLKAELESLRAAEGKRSLESAIGEAKAAKRLTPALEAKVREQVESGDLSLKGAEAMLSALPVIPALAAHDGQAAAQNRGTGNDASLQWKGKTYDQLSYSEKAELKREDVALYISMKGDK